MSIVLPDNIFGSRETEDLRRWINEKCRIIGVVGIPRNTFMPHTAVKTSILFLQKREKRANVKKTYFLQLVRNQEKMVEEIYYIKEIFTHGLKLTMI